MPALPCAVNRLFAGTCPSIQVIAIPELNGCRGVSDGAAGCREVVSGRRGPGSVVGGVRASGQPRPGGGRVRAGLRTGAGIEVGERQARASARPSPTLSGSASDRWPGSGLDVLRPARTRPPPPLPRGLRGARGGANGTGRGPAGAGPARATVSGIKAEEVSPRAHLPRQRTPRTPGSGTGRRAAPSTLAPEVIGYGSTRKRPGLRAR